MNDVQPPKSASVVERGFRDALDKFKAPLSSQDRDRFQYTTLEDLQREVLKIQAKQAAKFESMNLRRVQAFLEAFGQFGEVIEVFLNSSEFVGFVWGPMKFLLQVSGHPCEHVPPYAIVEPQSVP